MIDTTGNSDNLKVACMALDIFTKCWCIDCEFTEKHNHLTFSIFATSETLNNISYHPQKYQTM